MSLFKEDHNFHLFSVQIYNPYETNFEKIIFATVGGNRVTKI
jgi:hypothetical protein